MSKSDVIEIVGAREHNLKDVNLTIPRNKLVVFTGLSGSGKSSLAFDTIYAEGQRRYIETFSAYARQFLGGMERPDVDQITGLSPVISIEQKTVGRNPRSTVGTITEIYDFFRLLFARVGVAHSYKTGEKMVRYTDDQIVKLILKEYDGKKVIILAPKVKGRKGHYRELFEQIQKLGFTRVRVDGEIKEIKPGMKLSRYAIHDIEMVIDRIQVGPESKQRISESIQTALRYGGKSLLIQDFETAEIRHLSKSLMCPSTGISYPEPEPNLFSFNSPYGACKKCNGLGEVSEIDLDKMIPDKEMSIKAGAIKPLGEAKSNWVFNKIEKILDHYDLKMTEAIEGIPEDVIDLIIEGGSIESIVDGKQEELSFEGVASFVVDQFEANPKGSIRRWASSFMNKVACPTCNGSRLKKEAHYFLLNDCHIGDIAKLDFLELQDWIADLEKKLTKDQKIIGTEIIKEINDRLGFILQVGLYYLSLNRSARTLSGGEAQRIRLATQIGSQLVNVLYILDEPSIGLHQRDNTRLIESLMRLRDTGNSVIVVEHDKEMMEASDFIVDIGPGAGMHGGEIVNASTYKEMLKNDTVTSRFLNGASKIAIPKKRRKGNGKKLELYGATGHNLKNVDLKIPLGTFTCVTGVSGSGKSSLINQTLYPILNEHFYNAVKKPLPFKSVKGLEHIDKVIDIDQSPIGRTPRSNPATYTGMFTEIRNLYAKLPEAQIRGYKAGRFSFNVKGGRCEGCQGGGMKLVEMNFLPDVYVSCEDCQGKRYNYETLDVRYKGKSINDVLEMTIEKALVFFQDHPKIHRKLDTLNAVGLGYITIGQPSTTLSGGEAQRIKLATELSKKSTGKTMLILDEPSTGLHFQDIQLLIDVLNKLVEEGNSILVIEHNLDIVKVADYIIDIGPEGGKNGGAIVCQGTPEKICKDEDSLSYTVKYLAEELIH
jgi:excinuclease ABC subunit A